MPLPAFILPAPVARIGAHLPQLPPTLALVAGLNLALDRILPRDALEPLTGKRLLMKVNDAGLALRFSSLTPQVCSVHEPLTEAFDGVLALA